MATRLTCVQWGEGGLGSAERYRFCSASRPGRWARTPLTMQFTRMGCSEGSSTVVVQPWGDGCSRMTCARGSLPPAGAGNARPLTIQLERWWASMAAAMMRLERRCAGLARRWWRHDPERALGRNGGVWARREALLWPVRRHDKYLLLWIGIESGPMGRYGVHCRAWVWMWPSSEIVALPGRRAVGCTRHGVLPVLRPRRRERRCGLGLLRCETSFRASLLARAVDGGNGSLGCASAGF